MAIYVRKSKRKTILNILTCVILMYFTSKFTIRNILKENELIQVNEKRKRIYNHINTVSGFMPLSADNNNGPITVDRDSDDGTKVNIYSLMSKESAEEDQPSNIDLNQKVAIVMYSETVKVNSFVEHAISEFFQYSNIHGYRFLFNNQRYDREKEPFYMKIHVITEAILRGLKEKEYDWVFWVDGDVILANPNIKLQTFLPIDNEVHLIAADRQGLNSGVFFIRVHPWSLNFILRAGSYTYFNNSTYFKYGEETGINNVLIEYKEDKHYVIVPPDWFNAYPEKREKGQFLLHFCFRKGESKSRPSDVRQELSKESDYTDGKTSKDLRKEVLKYYKKSKRAQHQIKLRDS
ncbi:hypothetical protein H8356DRAFT_1048726 [Neocallimastix lanati (nom. inval.)]|nr:hypothetical protein H8356DRAFT_1048726 [Neocallimastix sp. JGI-2020a]